MIKKMVRILAGILFLIFAMNATSLIAATPDYIVVSIPEERPGDGRGYYPKSLYRDSSCMCGKDLTGADYIFEFYVPGSFNSVYPKKLNKLRITGTNKLADCYIPDKVSARVYKNDTIRACIGYLSVVWCAYVPYRNDVAMWMTK
ncbi:MAG: hypothetical protein V1688_00920 [bacterium]